MKGEKLTASLALLETLIPGGLSSFFDCMRFAEEEIAAAKQRHPKHVDKLHGSFKVLCPTSEMLKAEQLYRAHVRELLERVAAGEGTQLATRPEVLLQLSAASLTAPPSERYGALFEQLFVELHPDHVLTKLPRVYREKWKNSSAELLAELQQKFRDDNRRLS